jgi:ABC-type branched-subunit amino acid transport system substrate-binding protein
MLRRVAVLAVAATVAAACTDGNRSTTSGTPSPSPVPTTPSPAPAIDVALVVAEDRSGYLDGIETGVRQVNAAGGIDGVPLRMITADTPEKVAEPDVPAGIVVGDGGVVVRSRPEIEAAGDPVIVIGDDLYSRRQLYRQVFQANVPDLWQARALARLLVRDLGLRNLLLLTTDRETGAAYVAGFAEEGATLEGLRLPSAVSAADAVIMPDPAERVEVVIERIAEMRDPPLLALSAEGLGIEATLPPGTVAPYHYAWSGWAEPIPRVERFRRRFERMHGRSPEALEQEGYDAIRILAEALRRTDGRGGEELIRALEAVRDEDYSSLPLRLGPDDHVLLPQGQLGAFAVARPGTEAPGEALADANPWRPVMRTFTYNGERVTIVRRDLRVFFPRWRYPAPAPEFGGSRLGITSPAGVPPR